MNLSIIIPAVRDDSVVATTLESVIGCAAGHNAEILLIDNTPSGSLIDICRRFTGTGQLKYFHETASGLLSGRHRGVVEAKGDILVFVDDDVTVGATWLTSIVEAFEDPDVHLVGGKCLPLYETPLPPWFASNFISVTSGGWYCDWLSLIDQGDLQKDTEPEFVFGLNFSIRKSTLMILGGFHPDAFPDHLQYLQGDGETGLTRKLRERGLRAVYHPKASLLHRIPASRLTPLYFCKRAYYRGICDSYTELRARYRQRTLTFARSLIQNSMGRLRNFVQCARLQRNLPPRPDEETDPGIFGNWLKKAVARSAVAGRLFHLEAIRLQPELADWIQQDDYWDYQLPDFRIDASSIRAWALDRCNVPLRW